MPRHFDNTWLERIAGYLNGSGNGSLQVQGNIGTGATDSGKPVKIGAVYRSTAPTYSNGQRTEALADVNGNLLVSLATLIAGEDITNDRLKVEQRFSYARV